MYFPSHVSAGFLLAGAIQFTGLLTLNSFLIAFLVIYGLLPDLDAFLVDDMSEHHESFFHTPLFWLTISGLIYISGFPVLAVLGALATIFHLLTDYLFARTMGVKLFYPFSQKKYNLLETNPEFGHFNPTNPDIQELKEHLSFYCENRIIIFSEIVINIAGILSAYLLFS